METKSTLLDGYTDLEKGAYLCAIASISMADHSATGEEREYLETLCESAGVSEVQKELIMSAADLKMPEKDLERCLDVLKDSQLRFSLVSDVIAFAQSDNNYSEEEQHLVGKMATYLGVNEEQFSVLDQFTKKAVQDAPGEKETPGSGTPPENFLDKLGFGDKLKKAGIDSNMLLKGALGILGPLFLARMLGGKRGGMSGGRPRGGGLLGGLMGGGLLGSLLGGNRGFGGAGSMLSRFFGKRGL